MNSQEILDALKKALTDPKLDQVAVWALSKYLQDAWKKESGRPIRPFDLAKNLSNFYVDLSQHRLPDKIAKQTPDTEAWLMEFFGAAEGSLPRFWTQCIEIWEITLEPHPVYAREVKNYFEMLLKSSMQGKRSSDSAPSIRLPAAAKPEQGSGKAPASAAAAPEQQQAPTPVNDDTPETIVVRPTPQEELEPNVPKNAYLVLQGTRIIPLNRSFIKIGRQLDNHIILEDPRVSRYHAQLKLINDRFVIFDMHSSGGTHVNGKRTPQSVIYPGDVISLAGVTFIYSHEMPAKPGEVKIIELGSSIAADRPTAIMHREEVKETKIGKDGLPELPKTGPLPETGPLKK